MADIVIIGAGLTGLSTAYHLEQSGFNDFTICEKNNEVGGLCRSHQQDGFTFDYTGHILHINDPYFRSIVEKSIGFNNLATIHRNSFVYSENIYTPYPYQANLHGLSTQTICDCIEGFVQRPIKNNEPAMFTDWVVQNFGIGIGKHFFFPFQEKLFAHPITHITADWTSRFVPKITLSDIVNGITNNKKERQFGYNATLYYPKSGGIFSWINKFSQLLTKKIKLNHAVKSIDMTNKVILYENGITEKFTTLINTMPLKLFLSKLKSDFISTPLQKSFHKLLCNKVICFNLGIYSDHLKHKHWIYFPEKKFPFYRIGFPHMLSPYMTPHGCSSLSGELSYLDMPDDMIKKKIDDSLYAVKKLFSLSNDMIATKYIMNIDHAYVVYDQWRKQNVPRILSRLQEHGIHSIGRYGAWKYASMQEAVLDGKQCVETILNHQASSQRSHKICEC